MKRLRFLEVIDLNHTGGDLHQQIGPDSSLLSKIMTS